MKLAGKLVLILGLGESGLACALWCERNGARLRVADTRTEPPYLGELRRRVATADFRCGEFDKVLLDGIDLLVLSPGLSAGMMIVIHARAAGIPVVGEIELFAWALDDLGVRGQTQVIAITGTNGKTTTTALTGHLCRAAGRRTGVAGNISPAALTALMACQDEGKLPEVWVLELSSFQLETLETLNANAATVLNISDDHLDRYIDLDDYAAAKARIFHGDGVQVLNRDDAHVKPMAIAGRRIISFGLDAPGDTDDFGLRENRGEPWLVQGDRFLLSVSQLPIAGLHNAANAMAALALCAAVGFDSVSLLPALRQFRGLPHRVERVAEIDGVAWYDDSKGTNVGATVAALTGMGRKVVLILGGDGKGQDFSPLKAAVAAHARAVILIGRDGPLIGAAIAGCGVSVESAADLPEAVRKSAVAARRGDTVLLSPACASFDMFRNYEHRAQVFVDAVLRMAERA
ncbi:MAG: UDP-N-acetylmuramoyl-L-alanine--D-glutamate ligase [Rhodocyclaceae bacterium]|nr:UDP-N-acetylmuramoyl-L-alanine--D-glutamate ligase [Rhodocyclaceae bacterium]MBK6676822.1 UDP-N-acetylmuramoyl-L-alanine--D-glutamate ligase [Rhodocyclaceae bacterium]MBK9309450.1 UDP-N-acetylmuramoyl-L-alanine--D-glutamate ligase [Rhodocyclaceae bacterium]MBK9955457.1 UDP-N-acetylmuramoyl-L-alanine--D-glutamate ligase [Rhodocyclaceae bacterium]